MEIRIAEKAGFCFGVRRAIEMALQCTRDRDGPVYTLGPLIHNPQVVSELQGKGINKINSLNEAEQGGTVIIRSHGVAPGDFEEAARRGLKVVDATCPFVAKAQRLAQKLNEQGCKVVIVGEKDHPEVQGLVGWAGGDALVIKNPAETANIPKHDYIGVVAQTTQPKANFEEIVRILEAECDRIQVCDTICHATAERQKAAVDLSRQVDVMVVVGGRNSANTQKLTMLCQSTGTPTYQVEVAGELKPEWFRGVKRAGLTAGASTPDWIIEEVYRRMKEWGANMKEDVKSMEEKVGHGEQLEENAVENNDQEQEEMQATAANSHEQDTEQDNERMEEAVEVKSPRPGEIVSGTVVQINDDEVLVDVGAKSEGVIPQKELSCFDLDSPASILQVGDKIDVVVLKSEDSEGRLLLSKERADAKKAWRVLEEKMNAGEPVEGVVKEVVKGGVLVDLGLRAFLPASLVELGYVEDLSQYVGKTIKVKVIELNRSRRKVILSRKAVLEEEQAQKRADLLENLREGDVVKGIVRRLTNFGAFVDIGGIDGLLHISEMAWHRIEHPSDVVNVGDELEVKVLRVDKENEKVSLGLKQVLPNPWDDVESKYPPGSIVEAKVVRLAPFGAFVELEPGVEGLVHVSHLADHYVTEPGEVVSEGDIIKVKVLSVEPGEKRIRLSVREAKETKPPREREAKKQQVEQKPQEKPAYQDSGSDGATATIGEMVGDIFKQKE